MNFAFEHLTAENWKLNFIKTQLILCPVWITSTHKHYIAGLRKTLSTSYFYHTPSYSRSHILLLTSNYWKKHFQMEPSWSWSQKPFKLKNPQSRKVCDLLLTAEHNCVLCELRAFHWRWYNVDITGEVTGVRQSAYPGPLPPPAPPLCY